MKYNKKEQLLDKVNGLKFLKSSEQARYHNKAIDSAFERIEAFFDDEFVPEVPQYVADWYEDCKENLEYNIWNYIYNWERKENSAFKNWLDIGRNNPIQTLINMHQFGYTVEKEKRYIVKMKNVLDSTKYLVVSEITGKWLFANSGMGNIKKTHTHKELEEAGFGDVFNSPLFEVEEVKR